MARGWSQVYDTDPETGEWRDHRAFENPPSVSGPVPERQPYQAHETIYAAEQLIRERHKVVDADWKFWGNLADYLNYQASLGLHGGARGLNAAREFNRAHDMAVGLLAMQEAAERRAGPLS